MDKRHADPLPAAQYGIELLGVNSIDGVKTGTTPHAGECLVISSARAPESVKNGDTYMITPRRLIVVVLGAADRFKVANGLLNLGWQLYDQWAAKVPAHEKRRRTGIIEQGR